MKTPVRMEEYPYEISADAIYLLSCTTAVQVLFVQHVLPHRCHGGFPLTSGLEDVSLEESTPKRALWGMNPQHITVHAVPF